MIPQRRVDWRHVDLFDRAGTPRKRGAGAARRRRDDAGGDGRARRLFGRRRRVHGRAAEGGQRRRGGHRRRQPGRHSGGRRAARVSGRFETTARFGEQFRVARYTEVAPQTIDGLRRYLGSGLIKGIGPEFASRIVDRFGIETLEILDSDPARISEVPGIGPSRARAIRPAWSAQREVRKVMVFLQGYGVSPAFAARIYKRYGAAAIARVRENPYRLAFDVWGIGFLSADKLAAALGVARDAPARAEAGVRHVLDDEGGNGHVFVPRPRLAQKAAALLDLPEDSVDAAIDRLAQHGRRRASTRRWSRTRARPPSTRPASTGPRARWPPGCAKLLATPAPRTGDRSRRARSPGTSARRASRWRASRPRR